MTVDEYAVATKSIGIIETSAMGKVRVTGKDRIEVLHNVLTQDIKSLKPGSGAHAALLAANGKILMLMGVHVFEDFVLLTVNPEMAVKTMGFLEKFIITEDVTLKDVTAGYAMTCLTGPNSEWLVIKCLPQIYKTLQEMGGLLFQDGIVIRNSRLGMAGFDLLINAEKADEFNKKLLHEGRFMGAKPIGIETVNTIRIEAGMPCMGIDIFEETLLPETGLEKIMVSGTKGCYPGQEVVARIETYKGLNRKITGLLFEKEALPKPGSKIYADNGSEVGTITSAAISRELDKGIALAYMAKGFFEKDLFVKIAAEGGQISAKTVELPFIRRGRGGIQVL